MTRGEGERDNGEALSRNMYKGPMDKSKGGIGLSMGGGGWWDGGE